MDTKTNAGPLVELVRCEKNRGTSYREMSLRAERAGHEISHQQLQAYGAGHVRKAPSQRQIEAIAAAIASTPQAVRDAVFEQFYGYVTDSRRGPVAGEWTLDVPGDLAQEKRSELERLVAAWLRAIGDDDD